MGAPVGTRLYIGWLLVGTINSSRRPRLWQLELSTDAQRQVPAEGSSSADVMRQVCFRKRLQLSPTRRMGKIWHFASYRP